jgi:VWFA-related protein
MFGQTAAPERPTDQLVIDAVALDRNGMPVTDLRREEMEVWISGFRVPFQSFTSITASEERAARNVVLILDDMTLPLPLVPRAKEAARRFVDRMAPGDRMAIVMLNGGMMESTDDRSRLLKRIDSYTVSAIPPMRFEALGEHVLELVTGIARQISETSYGRKTIVGIGASWLFDTPIPPPTISRDLRAEWTEAMRALAWANASFYVIEPAGVGMAPFSGGSGGFADQTGGHAFVNTNDLTGVADRIMREAANYYLIGVADPPIQRKADLRELEVRVLRKGITVRARRAVPGTETTR